MQLDETPLVVASPSCRNYFDSERLGKNVGKTSGCQDRGRVKSKVGSRGLFADSFVSLFLTLTIITFIIKNVVDSYFNPEFSLTKYYIILQVSHKSPHKSLF